MGHGHLAGVDHVDAHGRLAVLGRDQPPLDRGGADTGQDIAAALRIADKGLVDEHLQEQVIDIGIGAAGR